MNNVFIGLGSNLGDRLGFLRQALREIEKLPNTSVLTASSIYHTEPVGLKTQPAFFNMVAELDSNLTPKELMLQLKSVERKVGRKETVRWGPREIDVDLLYYDTEVVAEGDPRVPHPEVANRRFVLVPLKEIAGEFVDPLRKLSIHELLRTCPDTSAVRKTSLSMGPSNNRQAGRAAKEN